MHVLPRVAELEERFPDSLVAIGVHAGKFTEERRTANIRHACARFGIAHPVVNDRHFRIWRAYGVQAWPTVALIAPDGSFVAVRSGEFEVEPMSETIAGVVEEAERTGTLVRDAPDFGSDPDAPAEPAGALRYPMRAIASGDFVYVSDTGNRRVLELRLDGEAAAVVTRAFGGGETGFADGAAADARFAEPQGLALADGALWVADRRNHAVRRVDLASGQVSTVAGTGELGAFRIVAGPGLSTALRSPWGLAADDKALYLTMAGSHQLWALDLARDDHALRLVAGTGAEAIDDGPAQHATLAQPTGVVVADGAVWVADCESSAVRRVDTVPRGEVRTIVGTGLFDFGDRDGAGDEVELQHDEDLAAWEGRLLVADTYNSKIKRVDPVTRRCEAHPGEAGSGEALYEPAGISAADGRVLVCDTNHHRIAWLDPETGALATIAVRE